jgi:hypothetical protein
MKALYNTLKVQFPLLSRKNVVAPEIIETGRAFQEAADEIKQTRKERSNLSKLASSAGIQLPRGVKDVPYVREGVQLVL